jgi:hypothetical protein
LSKTKETTMIKTAFLAATAIALFAAAPSVASAASALTTNESATYCGQASSADTGAAVDVGTGKSVDATVHCDSSGTKVSANSDNESESGPSEAAENGVED